MSSSDPPHGACDVCGERPALGVAAMPFVPMSCAYCRECAQSGAVIYEIAVANTAMCGGLERTSDEWRHVVAATLEQTQHSMDEFLADVREELAEMDDIHMYGGVMRAGEDF